VFLVCYYALTRLYLKNTLLFAGSMLFYFWGAAKLVVMLPLIGLLAWVFSWAIVKTRFKKLFLIISILSFITVLIWFKYMGFIIDNLMYLGMIKSSSLTILNTLGVSFFTLQAISYVAEVYKKNKRFEKNPLYVVLYISMFPQLLSGPFVRYHHLEVALKKRTFVFEQFYTGVRRFIIGLGKKLLIADTLSFVVCQIVDNDSITITPFVAWAGMFIFAIQIFFDFSGYTDMAIGVGKMLGFELPENFNYPYISRSITEFWRRWHMSFTAWIKEYIFNPLAIQWRYWGRFGMSLSLLITFFVCGLWHGSTWNFILWGVSQGVLLVIEDLFLLKWLKRLGIFSLLYVFFMVLTFLTFFRTPDLYHALGYLGKMFGPAQEGALGLEAFIANKHIVALIFGIALCIPFKIADKLKEKYKNLLKYMDTVFLIVVLILSVMKLLSETYNPFIYFRF